MKISSRYHSHPDHLALELTMRDVLDGMEEMASLSATAFPAECMEILSIEPPEAQHRPDGAATTSPGSAILLQFPRLAESA